MAVGLRVLWLCCVCYSLAAVAKDAFHEELLLKPLPTGHVHAHFQFTTVWNVDIRNSKEFSHYNLFPKSFGQIINKYAVEELHLTLTQGQWHHEQWGYATISAPVGAELWVWFQDQANQTVDEMWFGLTQALSGQFCASLNFINSKTTTSPQLSFRREGVTSTASTNSSLLRYAALPREVVCTENLTPWKKLLPCDSKAGLSTLLNSLLLYKVNYHSMGIHLRPICQDSSCTSFAVELLQTVSLVLDPILRGSLANQDWSLRKLFGQSIKSTCPLASTSKIYVDISSNKSMGSEFSVSPPPSEVVSKKLSDQWHQEFALYDLQALVKPGGSEEELNIVVKHKNKALQAVPPQLHAHRFVTGYGEEMGGITCVLHNNHPSQPLPVVYLATFPWFLRIFLHTLRIENNGNVIQPDLLNFVPAKDRQQPYTLELVFTLAPHSVTQLSIQFQRGFLRWTEHPPDAHHGFYINSAVISAKLTNPLNYITRSQQTSLIFSSGDDGLQEEGTFVRLHTEAVLITLPTPDFSMPYNVICLACTVVAIAFGSFHNLSTRRFEAVDPNTPSGPLGKIKAALNKLKGKLFGKKEDISEKKKKDN